MTAVKKAENNAGSKPQIAKPKAILFDWDNTLADTWHIIYEALHETFTAMGHEPWPFEDVKQGREGIHHSLRDSFPKIFGEGWEKAREVYFQSFLRHHLEKIRDLPDASSVLTHLSGTGLYTAVVSNKTGKYLREEVAHMGWDGYFHKVVGASDASEDKPHPAPIHLALEGSGIAAGPHVWFVGDSFTDIQCALNAGCTPVLFGENIRPEDMKAWPIDNHHLAKAKNHRELLELIREAIE
jgi:phosphoglycolate phosphatase